MAFRFNFEITNPFAKDFNNNIIYWKDIVFAENKSFEIQLNGWDHKYLFQLAAHWDDKNYDHRGFGVELALFGFWLDLHVYDHRHAEEPTAEEIAWFEEDQAKNRALYDEREFLKEQRAMEKAIKRKEEKEKRDIINKEQGLARQAALAAEANTTKE